MYDTLIMLDPETSISIHSRQTELEAFYKAHPKNRPVVAVEGTRLHIRWPDYSFEVAHSQLPHVIEESQEIAEEYAGSHPARERIALCASRFEMTGSDDPDMEHFNDYLYVIEAVQRLGTAYAFSSETCEFM